MNKTFKVLMVSFVLMLSMPAVTLAGGKAKARKVNWEPVMNAIIQVESNGKAHAKNGNQCGPMQITPIMVRECNNILKERNSTKRYKMSDRFSVAKSKEMFLLIQSHHNPQNDVEHAIRSWNGGPNYSVKHTQRYYEKVKSFL